MYDGNRILGSVVESPKSLFFLHSPSLPPGFAATGPPFHGSWPNLPRFDVLAISFLIWGFKLRPISTYPRLPIVTFSSLCCRAWLWFTPDLANESGNKSNEPSTS